MSSSTRCAIEMSFLALLDSGINSRRQRIGTFCVGTNIIASDPVSRFRCCYPKKTEGHYQDHTDVRGAASGAYNMANRVAYVLDLNGPSLFLDVACSSSLTATHLAIRSIEAGDCDAAVITGCQHNLRYVRQASSIKIFRSTVCLYSLWDWIVYHTHDVLSSERCRPFDSSADG